MRRLQQDDVHRWRCAFCSAFIFRAAAAATAATRQAVRQRCRRVTLQNRPRWRPARWAVGGPLSYPDAGAAAGASGITPSHDLCARQCGEGPGRRRRTCCLAEGPPPPGLSTGRRSSSAPPGGLGRGRGKRRGWVGGRVGAGMNGGASGGPSPGGGEGSAVCIEIHEVDGEAAGSTLRGLTSPSCPACP